MATHSSSLAWKLPWTEKPGRLQSMGSLRVRRNWVTLLSFSLSCIGEGNGNPLQCSCLENSRDGEPGGLPSMALHRVRHDWSNLAAAAALWFKIFHIAKYSYIYIFFIKLHTYLVNIGFNFLAVRISLGSCNIRTENLKHQSIVPQSLSLLFLWPHLSITIFYGISVLVIQITLLNDQSNTPIISD